jgi:hypothetical protein
MKKREKRSVNAVSFPFLEEEEEIEKEEEDVCITSNRTRTARRDA